MQYLKKNKQKTGFNILKMSFFVKESIIDGPFCGYKKN